MKVWVGLMIVMVVSMGGTCGTADVPGAANELPEQTPLPPADQDGDGLSDEDELNLGTDLTRKDTDMDDIPDAEDESPIGATTTISRVLCDGRYILLANGMFFRDYNGVTGDWETSQAVGVCGELKFLWNVDLRELASSLDEGFGWETTIQAITTENVPNPYTGNPWGRRWLLYIADGTKWDVGIEYYSYYNPNPVEDWIAGQIVVFFTPAGSSFPLIVNNGDCSLGTHDVTARPAQ